MGVISQCMHISNHYLNTLNILFYLSIITQKIWGKKNIYRKLIANIKLNGEKLAAVLAGTSRGCPLTLTTSIHHHPGSLS